MALNKTFGPLPLPKLDSKLKKNKIKYTASDYH